MLMTAGGFNFGSGASAPSRRPDLIQAILNRDHREISSLMKVCWDWYVADDSGQTVLHVAVKKRCEKPDEQKDVVKILNRFLHLHRVKVNVKDDAGRTPLHLAAKNGMLRVVDFLIEKGASLHSRDERGNGILHYMVEGEFEKCFEETRKVSSPDELRDFFEESINFFKAMLEKNVGVNYVNKIPESPLHVAVARNLLHIIPILLDHTHDVTLRNKENQNVLHLFIENKNSGTFKAVSNSCYDESLVMDIFNAMLSLGFSMMDVDAQGNTLLHSAVHQDKPQFIEMILEKFGQVDMRDSEGNTILHIVIDNCIDSTTKEHKEECMELVCNLLNSGVDIDQRNKNGLKPLHIAVMRVHPEIMQVLAEYGAVLQEPYNGGNLLHLLSLDSSNIISSSKVEEVVELLVRQGCDLNAMNEDGLTPLHLAVKSGRNDLIEVLIKFDANVDVRELNAPGFTPLQMAVVGNHDYLLDPLINHGADVNVKDFSGKTALHLAMTLKNDVVKTLLRSGAHVEVEDGDELLPLHYAIRNQNDVALAELLKFGADINDIGTYQELMCLENPDLLLFAVLEHWIKMKAAGLLIAPEYGTHASDDTYQELYQDCLVEIESLKEYKIGDLKSLYDLLHMDRNFRCAYTVNQPLIDLIDSDTFETTFPKYHVLILASYHEALARQKLLEPAKRAWCEFTDILLPDVCIYRILTHLTNRDLRVMVEGLDAML